MSKKEDKKEKEESSGTAWYAWMGYAVVCFALSGYLWWFFTDSERSGGTRRINAIVAGLYNALGKVPTVAVFAGVGGVFLVLGVLGLVKKQKE